MKFYIGVRYAEGCHPNEFWKTYFTSSNYVIACRDLNGEPNHIETFTFATANEAIAKEKQLIREFLDEYVVGSRAGAVTR